MTKPTTPIKSRQDEPVTVQVGVRSISDHTIADTCSACGYRPGFDWPWLIVESLAFCSTPCRDARFRRFKRAIVESAVFTSGGERYYFRRVAPGDPV